jgi:hypothetical protein
MRFIGFLAMLGIGVLAIHGSVAQAAAPEGYKWKVTTSMQMGGMRMPGQTTTICRTGEESPAIASKEGCETKDFQRSGKTETFRVVCTGEHAMEGTVKLTYDSDEHYTGLMNMSVGGQTMNMAYEGNRVGPCDGTEANMQRAKYEKMAKDIQKQGDDAKRQMCQAGARNATMLLDPSCRAPEDVKTYCTNFQAHDAFLFQKTRAGGDTFKQTLTLCHLDAAEVQNRLCSTALNAGKIDFLASQCGAAASAFANANCTGRSFTAIAPANRNICGQLRNAGVWSGGKSR